MKDVVDILKDLVRIPSASFLSNQAVIEYAQSALDQVGWHTARSVFRESSGAEKINLIATPPGQRSEESVVALAFLCHTDTVPPAKDWAAALEPFVQDDVLYGCGACDVKGFLACLLAAISEAPDAGYRDGLRIVLTADEEIGCLGAHRLRAEELLRPRALIIGEPTSLHPARAGKGYCLGEVTVFGSEAHSAHPNRGRSAIYDAAKIIQAIERIAEEIAKENDPIFEPPYTTINIGTIQGGTAKNIVPAECRFLIEWRPIPSRPLEDVPYRIRCVLEDMQREDPGLRYDFTVQRQQSGFETCAASDLVLALERLTGRQPTSIPFGSEASVFAAIAEQIVVFGPGDMRTAHSPRECVPISELEKAVFCIRSIMQNDSPCTI